MSGAHSWINQLQSEPEIKWGQPIHSVNTGGEAEGWLWILEVHCMDSECSKPKGSLEKSI